MLAPRFVSAARTRPVLAALAAATALMTGTAGCTGLHVHVAASHKGAHHQHRKKSHHKSRHHARHHGTTAPAAGSSSLQLVTEPGDGFGPVYRLIDHASRSVDMTMYELADMTAERDLAKAEHRGVRVRVILDPKEKEVDSAAYRYLRSHHVRVVWSSSRFTYTHEKSLVIDKSAAVIMTANLTSRYYRTSRDFVVIDRDHADITAVARVFSADFVHHQIRPGDGRDLVWSPTDSQRKLLALINGAKHSLRVYSEEMGDTVMEDALIKAAKRGVHVQVCGENEDGEYTSAYRKLARAGIKISYYSSSDGFYIHGKVIEADYATGHGRVFIGSENFSSTSLNQNRELGLIISRDVILSSIARSFATDFRNGKHFS